MSTTTSSTNEGVEVTGRSVKTTGTWTFDQPSGNYAKVAAVQGATEKAFMDSAVAFVVAMVEADARGEAKIPPGAVRYHALVSAYNAWNSAKELEAEIRCNWVALAVSDATPEQAEALQKEIDKLAVPPAPPIPPAPPAKPKAKRRRRP